MLFSSPSPRQRIVTLRACVEKNIAACPAELPAPTMCTSRPWTFGASLRAAPYEMPLPASRSKPSIASCRQETPHARMIVRARRTSPPSRCTWRVVRVDARDRARDEDLGAEPPRLLQRAARQLVARHARREAEVVLDPRRGAGLAAGRLALDDDRAQALRRAVHRRGEARRGRRRRSPCRTPRRSGSVPRPSSSATRRSCGSTTVLPSTTRIAGQSASAGSGPPHCSAASGVVGREPLERDLVAVEEAPQLGAGGVPAVPDDDRARRRRLGGEPLQAARAAHPVRSRAGRPPSRRRARPPRPRGSRAARSA